MDKKNQDFLLAAKDSIAKSVISKKPVAKKKNKGKKKRKTAASELSNMFVKASEIRKRAANKNIETKFDEYVLRENAEYSISTNAYNARVAYLKLLDSLEKNKLLTAEITSIEEINNYWTAVTFIGPFKVMIPIFEFVDISVTHDSEKTKQDLRVLMSKRLGSTVDFIVKHLDQEAGIAVASRKDAMAKKRKFFFEEPFEGDILIKAGDIVKARVAATAPFGLIVEIMGVEAFIPSKEISDYYVLDASKYFKVGSEEDVKIINIEKNNSDEIEIEASIAEVSREIYKRVKDQVVPDKKYVGRISAINGYGVFVNITLGELPVDVLCAYPKYGNMPVIGAHATVNITMKNEKGLYGTIQHIAVE